MGRACRGKKRSDWQLLCKIAELAENILAVFCVATFENVLPQPLRLTNNQ